MTFAIVSQLNEKIFQWFPHSAGCASWVRWKWLIQLADYDILRLISAEITIFINKFKATIISNFEPPMCGDCGKFWVYVSGKDRDSTFFSEPYLITNAIKRRKTIQKNRLSSWVWKNPDSVGCANWVRLFLANSAGWIWILTQLAELEPSLVIGLSRWLLKK